MVIVPTAMSFSCGELLCSSTTFADQTTEVQCISSALETILKQKRSLWEYIQHTLQAESVSFYQVVATLYKLNHTAGYRMIAN